MAVTKAALKALNRLAPLPLAESWDNVGTLIDPPIPPSATSTTINKKTKILLTTDLNSSILNTVPLDQISLICTYHPTLFRPIARLLGDQDPLSDCLMKCIQYGITVYSPHTALDAANEGINDWIAESLLDDDNQEVLSQQSSSNHRSHKWKQYIKPISPKVDANGMKILNHEDASAGKLVAFPKKITCNKLIQRVKSTFHLETVMFAKGLGSNDEISTLAICPGSGGSIFKGISADCYLTGEMGHHDILAAVNRGISVILCNHSNTERPYLKEYFKNILQREIITILQEEEEGEEREGSKQKDDNKDDNKKFDFKLIDDVEVLVSDIDQDPLKFM